MSSKEFPQGYPRSKSEAHVSREDLDSAMAAFDLSQVPSSSKGSGIDTSNVDHTSTTSLSTEDALPTLFDYESDMMVKDEPSSIVVALS